MSDNPSGIAYPFRFAAAGGVMRSEGVEKVKDNLIAIAKTAIGDRLIRKKVGTIGYTRVLRNASDTSLGAIRDLIREALTRYERRARIISVEVRSEVDNGSQIVFLDVDFIYKATGTVESLSEQIYRG